MRNGGGERITVNFRYYRNRAKGKNGAFEVPAAYLRLQLHSSPAKQTSQCASWPCPAYSAQRHSHIWGITIYHEDTGHNDDWWVHLRDFPDTLRACRRIKYRTSMCVEPFHTLLNYISPLKPFADDLIQCDFKWLNSQGLVVSSV